MNRPSTDGRKGGLEIGSGQRNRNVVLATSEYGVPGVERPGAVLVAEQLEGHSPQNLIPK